MTQEQEENKQVVRMRECMKKVSAILDEFDAQIVYREERVNGQITGGGITFVPKPPRIVPVPDLVAGGIKPKNNS